jgi:Ser/Thr protein kinase RdoA (MazF antagonist)
LRIDSKGNGNQEKYLIKFYNAVESSKTDFLDALGEFCETLSGNVADARITIPKSIRSLEGSTYVIVSDCTIGSSGALSPIAVRLFSWVPGVTLNAHGSTLQLLNQVGRAIGIATRALSGFDHSSFHRYHAWDLSQFADVSKFIPFVDDQHIKQLVTDVHCTFLTNLLPQSESFPRSIVLGRSVPLLLRSHGHIRRLQRRQHNCRSGHSLLDRVDRLWRLGVHVDCCRHCHRYGICEFELS